MKADKDKTLKLLKTARGQLDGLVKMVEEDRYCIDISTQLLATQALLKRINRDVLQAHLDHCVTDALSSGDPAEASQKIREVMDIVNKLSR